MQELHEHPLFPLSGKVSFLPTVETGHLPPCISLLFSHFLPAWCFPFSGLYVHRWFVSEFSSGPVEVSINWHSSWVLELVFLNIFDHASLPWCLGYGSGQRGAVWSPQINCREQNPSLAHDESAHSSTGNSQHILVWSLWGFQSQAQKGLHLPKMLTESSWWSYRSWCNLILLRESVTT